MTQPDPAPSATLHDVLRRAGVQYDHYKIKCVERRIAARMRARGAQTYDEYADVLHADPAESQRLARALTINVSRFFRNWIAYRTLAEQVVPELWARNSRFIRVWSAGCASGEEPYSAAALFHDYAVRHGGAGRVERVRILGSDIDDESLAVAQRGTYRTHALSETPRELRDRYFEAADGRVTVAADLREIVNFEHRDLILDREPAERFDLVLCRNVIIYLEARAQEALLERFYRCTRPGAYLMLGKVEAVLGRPREWFKPVVIRSRIYRRTD